MNLCRIFGHKPTWMTLKFGNTSQGFACWRCGVRLGWDGRHNFTPFHNRDGTPELVPPEVLARSRTNRLQKTGHWYSTIANDNEASYQRGEVTLTPIDPDDLPDEIKRLEKVRRSRGID